MKRVAIVGAGPSGLPSIRHALLYGFEPVCFEASDALGGLWNYRDEAGGATSVMRSTILNTSKEMTAYSDFPPAEDEANYMHHSRMLNYLHSYAAHYNLDKYIRLNHKVICISRSEDFTLTGRWNVEFETNGFVSTEQFDAVLVCTGHHQIPNFPPELKGQKEFKGKISHAHDYKTPEAFIGKRVLCVGVGNSGLDIAVELSRVAKKLYLSSRRGVWIKNRCCADGIPTDMVTEARLRKHFLKRLPPRLRQEVVKRICDVKFDHDIYGLKPDFCMANAHLSVNDEIGHRIACKTMEIVGDIMEFKENSVVFKSGIETDVDEIIFATGYKIGFPLIENSRLISSDDNWVRLYKNMFAPELEPNTLAIIGLIQATSAINAVSEMQARFFFSQLTGECKMPSRMDMERDIEGQIKYLKETFVASPRHTIQVDYTVYMDDLASRIGCLPNYSALLRSDPVLAYYSFVHANTSYNYRIQGPHLSFGAFSCEKQLVPAAEIAKLQGRPIILERTDSNGKSCRLALPAVPVCLGRCRSAEFGTSTSEFRQQNSSMCGYVNVKYEYLTMTDCDVGADISIRRVKVVDSSVKCGCVPVPLKDHHQP